MSEAVTLSVSLPTETVELEVVTAARGRDGETPTGAVLYTAQTLTAPEQAQVAENLGASAGAPGDDTSNDKLAKFGASGELRGQTRVENGIAVFGQATSLAGSNGYGVYGVSTSGIGGLSTSGSGTYHHAFGITGDNRSFVARVLGSFGWFRGVYTGILHAAATLTANRTWALPDRDGGVSLEPIVQSSSFTAANGQAYHITATATVTDPSPTQGQGFVVFVRNGTATVGGTAYSTAGTVIERIFHSGAWANYVYLNKAQLDSAYATAAQGTQAGIVEIQLAASDETTALTVGDGKVVFRAPCAFLLTAVRASVTTAPTGSTLQVQIRNAGNDVLSTKLSIDASEKTSTTAATPAVINTSFDDFADDAEIHIDLDQVGSTIAGTGLKITLIGTRE